MAGVRLRRSRSRCWAIVTIALGLFFRTSASFGQTYGPLAGMVALMLWAMLSSMALFYGAAVAAQLEAVRAGRAEPQDEEKVAESEPSGAGPRRGAAPARRERRRARRSAHSAAIDRVRRTLEGVLGVPATEGNQIDVLRNGDEIFPAMFDAIEGRGTRSTS